MDDQGELGRHVSHTAVRLVLEHVARLTDDDGVVEVLRRAGEERPLAELLDDAGWSSYAEFRRLLESTTQSITEDQLRTMGVEADLTGGSMPSATEMLQALGSPGVLFAELGKGHTGIVSFLDVVAHEVGPTEWIIECRTRPGYEPYPAFCAFSAGLYPMTPRLFGYEQVDVTEDTCQLHGADACRFRVRWDEGDERDVQINALEHRITLLERRLETFQTTVGELVQADDLPTALDRVVSAAARAVRAPGFLLVVEPQPGSPRQVYSAGLSPADAERMGELLLAGTPHPALELVVEVASSRRHYGRLAAYDPDSVVLAEGPMLAAYARLAATALDSATALEETRREADRARALLTLSAALAEIASTEEMALSLARAVPAVIGADLATVTVIDREAGVARVIACHGYEAAEAEALLGTEIPLAGELVDTIRYVGPEDVTPPTRAILLSKARVVVPVIVDGQPEAWLTANVRDRPERLAPNDELEARLRGLAAQASTALRNARLVEQIRHQALHDALTGLPNRALILDRTDQLLSRARRERQPVAALFLDLDGFKEINDTLGHAAGDQLLRAVASRLATTIRESDTLARLGGDEFVVLVDGVSLDSGPELVAERLLEVLRPPFLLEGREQTPLTVTASIGIATATDRASAGDLLRDADVALYQAKAAGKNCSVVFAPAMQTAVRDRLELEMDLRQAVEAGEFVLAYQPIFDLCDRQVTGVEALLRWEHPTRGTLQPDGFVPLLEDTGLIVQVGAWVLEEACRQAAVWRSDGHVLDMSVNVSARQLESDRLLDDVRTALALADLPATSLVVEITETAIMHDTEATVRRLRALKALGVRLAIDDFGTGYSSLAYLRQFPVDSLKIDRSFITGLGESSDAVALVHTLVDLGKALGLTTLAEGIEDDAQYALLQSETCDRGQGFLVSRPLSPADLERFLGNRVTDATAKVSPN
jgi:diguanylate cyclase (GGDEF)-like protein